MGGSTGGGHVHSSATCQETYCAGTHDYFRGEIEWIFFLPFLRVALSPSSVPVLNQLYAVYHFSPPKPWIRWDNTEYLLYVIFMVILALLDLVWFTFSVGRQQADSSPCLSEVCQDGVQGLWCSCHWLLCWPLCHCHAPCRWASRLAHILHPNTPYPIHMFQYHSWFCSWSHSHSQNIVCTRWLVLLTCTTCTMSGDVFFFNGQYDSCTMLHLYLSDSSLCSWSAVWESPYDRASSAESFEAALSLRRAQCQQSVPWVPLPCPHCFQKGKSVGH